jgi:hypothetical protein
MNLVLSIVDVWLNQITQKERVILKERWEHQKYAGFWQRTYKDPLFITGEAALVGGIITYVLISKDEGFPPPPPRPDGN